MAQVLAAANTLFRDRDFFIHDGSRLRRFRVSAPFQAFLFLIVMMLVGWASFATARLIARPHGVAVMGLSAATEARAPPNGPPPAPIETPLQGGPGGPPPLFPAAPAG